MKTYGETYGPTTEGKTININMVIVNINSSGDNGSREGWIRPGEGHGWLSSREGKLYYRKKIMEGMLD